MIRIKWPKKPWLWLPLLTLVIVTGLILGPIAGWLWPGNWWGTNLIVLMNENEARPCGGFVTAYGEAKLPFGSNSLKNSFEFPVIPLGQNSEPLSNVAFDRKFWDLGDTANLGQCGTQFAEAYAKTGENPNRVVLVQSSVIEAWLKALGPIKVGEYDLDEHNFFATTSRLVADVDRHDEAALAARKNPLSSFGKQLIKTTLVRFWRWPSVARAFGDQQKNGAIYFHRTDTDKVSEWQKHKDQLITVSEWNLGGGKSSRYLDKSWTVYVRQRTKDLWDIEITITAKHLGGQDEPLSQPWKGGFEVQVLQGEPVFVPAELEPGKTFRHTQSFSVGSRGLNPDPLQPYNLWLYAPPYQHWDTHVQLSALAQQTINPRNTDLTVQENIGRWQGTAPLAGRQLTWQLVPDQTPPFLTWHKPLDGKNLSTKTRLDLKHSQKNLLVEVHFNEPSQLLGRTEIKSNSDNQIFRGEDLGIRLVDRDYEDKTLTEDPKIKTALLYPDGQTLLLSVEQAQFQPNERYYLEIDNLADTWGNKTDIKGRTVITR